jgi:hypothetical protein
VLESDFMGNNENEMELLRLIRKNGLENKEEEELLYRIEVKELSRQALIDYYRVQERVERGVEILRLDGQYEVIIDNDM